MQQTAEYKLEQFRNDRLEQLGLLCYNYVIDGITSFPQLSLLARTIHDNFHLLTKWRRNKAVGEDAVRDMEIRISELLREMGCVCFNLYIDQKLYSSDVLALCSAISELNRELEHVRQTPMNVSTPLSASYPYGMEPIPVNYRSCKCGYRNRPEARYCARCGAKL